jgi:glutamate dehydrogenase/leucine dehydrogenase
MCVTEAAICHVPRSDQVVLESESTFAPGKAANAGG